jgi:uncharacterized protein YjiS (DUF1127 family)
MNAWLDFPKTLCSSGAKSPICWASKEGETEMNIRQKLNQFASYRRTVRELRTLDAHQLADIGISRGEIAAVARAQFQ